MAVFDSRKPTSVGLHQKVWSISCESSENESDDVVLPRFRSELKEDLRRELLVRDVFTLEQAIQLVQDLDQSQFSLFPKCTDYKNNANKTTTVKSWPNLSQSQSCFESSSSTLRHEDKSKGNASELSRSIQQTRCFKCQGFGHVSAQCPSKARTLIIETQSDSDQDDLEEEVHDPEGDTWEDFDVDQAATLGCLLSMHPSSIDDIDDPPSKCSEMCFNSTYEKWRLA